jgi:epoxyqueuosine reductase
LTKDELKTAARDLGFSAVGVCDAAPAPHLDFFDRWTARGHHASMEWLAASRPLRSDPRAILPGAQSVIAVALDYNRPNPPVPGQPRIARYALGRDYHKVLRGKLKRLAALLEAEGHAARPCVDSAPVFERDFARLAGLGWFGKNTMLIDSQRGSWWFIGLLLTTASFEPDPPAEGGCGTCTRCIDACPTGAIVFADGRWGVDSRRCISYLTIEHEGPIEKDLASKMGEWTFGCDVCQEVCPFNAERASQPLRGSRATDPDLLTRRQWPSLEAIEALPDDEWDLLTRGSPVRRTGLEGLRRNARINLDNATK